MLQVVHDEINNSDSSCWKSGIFNLRLTLEQNLIDNFA